ncbi:Chemotaxis protein CheC, inhibitor of MCP methylation [Halapricum desulfuricans]|uniref:Chemotaxis protein CheC, inhibitor of MCP methylation n=1 Tax=Halapricum desulfuricans TaxID=2841257 RepID=A0A897NKF4_9EURY|nr:chemotaxis protein CheC [Halapricum desulfuricans]QSG11925.1 Chemotaxis protein CheC, inhibitor of MCP methylation [Halapricum desulfuricans]
MQVDADSLEQLNLRTRDGAERAGKQFSDTIGVETTIGASRIRITSQQDLVAALLTGDEECLKFDVTGPLSGTALLTFDEGVRSLVRSRSDEEGVDGLASELFDAFVDEWESYVGGDLRVETVTYVPDPAVHDFGFDSISDDAESTPLFQGSIDVVGRPGRVKLYLVPDAASLETLLSKEGNERVEIGDDATSDGGDTSFGESDSGLFESDDGTSTPLSLDKLSVFSDLTRAGTRAAAERVTAFTGIETDTEIAGINFTPIDDISTSLDADSYVGTTLEFEGKPSGHLAIMFPDESARRVAEEMLPTDPDGDGLTQMHRSALEELGNNMASGFIDGWANVLQTAVDHTPPEFSDDMEMTLIELVTEQLGPFQTHAYTIESRITTDSVAFDCEIHALPNETQLSEALDDLLVSRRDRTEADPDEIF